MKAGARTHLNGWTAEEMEAYGARLAAEKELAEGKAGLGKAGLEGAKKKAESFKFDLSAPASLKEVFEEEAKRLELALEQEGERIKQHYGDLSKREMSRVLRYEKEIEICRNCKGLPCKKLDHKLSKPTLSRAWKNELVLTFDDWCEYEKTRRFNNKFGLANIPQEYLGKTFDDYEVDKNNEVAVKAAKKLAELTNKGAYFYGNVGTGKTYLASIIAQEILKRGRNVIFATVPTISMQIRSSYNNKTGYSEAQILEKLYKVPTLILDDIGIEKPTRFVCSTLCNIFNERYNARLQTIMTSNYSLKEMAEIFNNPSDSQKTLDGTRIYDRCKQMCFPIELKGGSRRR